MTSRLFFPLLLTSFWLAGAADWPQFRGPLGTGVAQDKSLPVKFGPDQNLIWKTPLPPGHSSPIVVGSRIFLTAFEGDELLTIGLDRASGKVLWRRVAPRPRHEPVQVAGSPASPTPVSDGRSVYVFFGDFGILCYGIDGEERWKAPLGPFNNMYGHGSSPVLFDDKVVLICDQDTDSYLLALDKNTGRVRWKVERPEVTRGYATPGLYRPKKGPAEVIVPGAYQLTAYNLSTGEKLWWARGLAWQLKSVPVIDGDIVYVNGWEGTGDVDTPAETPAFEELLAKYDANKDGKISRSEAPPDIERWFSLQDFNHDGMLDAREWNFYRAMKAARNGLIAVRAGGRGDVTATHVLWRYGKALPNTPSPLLYQNVLYLVKDGGVVTTLNPKTGQPIKQGRLTGALDRYWASPVAGDGKVYTVSDACKVAVLKAGGEWEILAVNDLNDTCFATPAIADSRLYVRTRSALYCFGRPEEEHFPDGSTGQITEFQGVGGTAIPAYVRKPAGPGPFPVIVNLHGGNPSPEAAYSYGRGGKGFGLVAEYIAAGWAVYSLDFRARSARGFDPIVYEDTVLGIETARRLPFVDKDRLALTGGSSGGHVINRMISRVDARCAVLNSPTYIDYGQMHRALSTEKGEVLERIKLLKTIFDDYIEPRPEAWEIFKNASALAEAGRVRCPLLIIDGGTDVSLPHWMVNEYVEKLRGAGKTVETYLPEVGLHGFYYTDTPEGKEAQKRTLEFFKKYLAKR